MKYSPEVEKALVLIKTAEKERRYLQDIHSLAKETASKARQAWYDSSFKVVALKEELLAPLLSKFNIGDKVLVTKAKKQNGELLSPWIDSEGFVTRVLCRIRANGEIEFEYHINSAKKDGTMSKNSLYVKDYEFFESKMKMITKNEK